MRKIYSYILIAMIAAFTSSCSDDINVDNSMQNDSPYTFTFAAAKAQTATGDVNSQLCDGSVIQDLAVFFCKETNNQGSLVTEVVAYRCITGITNPQTLLKFDMSKTTADTDWVLGFDGATVTIAEATSGGSKTGVNIKEPAPGEYSVYAVANFTGVKAVNDIIKAANTAVGEQSDATLETTLEGKLTELKNAQFSIGTNNLCNAKAKMPLSLRDIMQIGPGQNNHLSHLLRAYTRIKVTVRNEGRNKAIKVSDIKFNKFTQSQIPVFVLPQYAPATGLKTPNIVLDGKRGQNSLALIPFDNTINIPFNGNQEKKPNSAVLFDGYILESSAEDKGRDTKYTIGMTVGWNTGTQGNVPTGEVEVTYSTGNSAATMTKGSDKAYIIKVKSGTNVGKVFYYNGSNMELKDGTSLNLQEIYNTGGDEEVNKYLWYYENTNTSSPYEPVIRSMYNTGVHMKRNTDGPTFDTTNGEAISFVTGTVNGGYNIENGMFYWDGNLGEGTKPTDCDGWDYDFSNPQLKHVHFYLNPDKMNWFTQGFNLIKKDKGAWFWATKEAHYEAKPMPTGPYFEFIPVTRTEKEKTELGDIYENKTANFNFTKLVNDRSEVVRSIHRNDFYNIFINVRFNESSKTFDISVDNWNDVDLPIEFN